MAEVRDLPDPVAGCRRLAGIWDVAAQRFWYGLGKKSHSALNQRELVQSHRSAKRQE
jgi:hypothetical protein